MIFVFFHISTVPEAENSQPALMVRSIRKYYPKVDIVQVTDGDTQVVSGVSDVFRAKGNQEEIMSFRTNAFSELRLKENAIYLDTDMLILKKLKIEKIFKEGEVFLLKRDFNNDQFINTSFGGMDLSYLVGKTVGEVWPYIGCFVGATSYEFWSYCSDYLNKLDKQSKRWFGDQEAIREVAKNNYFKITEVSEKEFACPPKFIKKDKPPSIIHFKGPQNKSLMLSIAKQIGL